MIVGIEIGRFRLPLLRTLEPTPDSERRLFMPWAKGMMASEKQQSYSSANTKCIIKCWIITQWAPATKHSRASDVATVCYGKSWWLVMAAESALREESKTTNLKMPCFPRCHRSQLFGWIDETQVLEEVAQHHLFQKLLSETVRQRVNASKKWSWSVTICSYTMIFITIPPTLKGVWWLKRYCTWTNVHTWSYMCIYGSITPRVR